MRKLPYSYIFTDLPRIGVSSRKNPDNAACEPADYSHMNDLHYLHPNADLLDGYAMNRLSEDQTCYVEEHLLLCASCCNALSVLDRDIKLMRTILGPQNAARPVWTRVLETTVSR